jgi:hypothetical protein
MAEMPEREQFSVPLKCPKCDHAGSVVWEETIGPGRQRGPERILILLASGFRQGEGTTRSGDPSIVCNHCDTVQPD